MYTDLLIDWALQTLIYCNFELEGSTVTIYISHPLISGLQEPGLRKVIRLARSYTASQWQSLTQLSHKP